MEAVSCGVREKQVRESGLYSRVRGNHFEGSERL